MENDLKDLGQLDVGNILQSYLEKPKDKTATVQCNPNTPMSSKESETEIDYEELSYYEEECLTYNCIEYVVMASISMVRKVFRKEKKIDRDSLNKLRQIDDVNYEESLAEISSQDEIDMTSLNKLRQIDDVNYEESLAEISCQDEIDRTSLNKLRQKDDVNYEESLAEISCQDQIPLLKTSCVPTVVMADDERKLNQEIIENYVNIIIENEEPVCSYNFPEEKYVKEKRRTIVHDETTNQSSNKTDLNEGPKKETEIAGEVEKSPVSLKKYSYEYDTSKMWCPTDISDPFTPGLVFEVNYLMFLFTLICNIIAKDEKHINNYQEFIVDVLQFPVTTYEYKQNRMWNPLDVTNPFCEGLSFEVAFIDIHIFEI